MPFAVKGTMNVGPAIESLREFKQAVQNRIMRKATEAGAKLIFDVAKAFVPKETGLLRKSLGRVTRTYKNIVIVVIGPRSKPSFRKPVTIKKDRVFRMVRGRRVRMRKPRPDQLTMIRWPTKYMHLVEKHSAPLKRAFDTTKAAAQKAMADKIAVEVPKEAAKAAQKSAKGTK